MFLLHDFRYMHLCYVLFIAHILFELENSKLIEKRFFVFIFPVICVTYAVEGSLPTSDSIFTPYSIEMSMFENKKTIKHH